MSEFEVARELKALGLAYLSGENLEVRKQLGQAPLTPSILKDCLVLPPRSRLSVPKSTAERSVSDLGGLFSSQIAPVSGSREDLLEVILSEYETVTQSADRVGIFTSGGWDSRLELAFIVEATRRRGTKIDLLHLQHNEIENEIAREIATRLGCGLVEFSLPETLARYQAAASQDELRAISELPTWRPTIPLYKTVTRQYLQERGDRVVGYGPHSLKGRQYDLALGHRPPNEGRFRIIGMDLGGAQKSVATLEGQYSVWDNLRRVSATWDEYAQRDYLDWVLTLFSYGHRVWPQIIGDIHQVSNRSVIVERFMGLKPSEKKGISFARWALKRLLPSLLDIDLVSSTGEVGIHKAQGDRGPRKTMSFDLESRIVDTLEAERPPDSFGSRGNGKPLNEIQLENFARLVEGT